MQVLGVGKENDWWRRFCVEGESNSGESKSGYGWGGVG